MAISKWEAAMYGYITGRALPKGTTRMAAKAALAAAVTAGRAVSPYAQRAAVAALPPVARAVANPYVGVPLGLATAAYGTQQYLDESGMQEEINVAKDQFIADLLPTARKARKKQTSTYNKAVSKAMKAIKSSNLHGKKGTITNPKKTFGTVSKTVSKVMAGKIKGRPRVKATGLIKRTIEKAFPGIVKFGKRKGRPSETVRKTRHKTKRRTSNEYTVRKL
jgi:hypothetical protein